MKAFKILGAILFTFFAYWQLNDKVQYATAWWHGWFLTYSGMVLLCIISIFKKFDRRVYLGIALAAGVHALFRMSSIQIQDSIFFNGNNPAGNEAGGLLVVAFWCICLSR